jgi:hypothetical protein
MNEQIHRGLCCLLAGASLAALAACAETVKQNPPDPRNTLIPKAGEQQGTPPPTAVKDGPLESLPGGGGPRMSDGEAPPAGGAPREGTGAAAEPPPPGGPSPEMTFFVTSTGNGDEGGNLGGLAGADAICQKLADAAGAGKRTWRAYLSTSRENARDRIGRGPWKNARGKQVSTSPDELARSGVPGDRVFDERGGRIDMKNAHDILTGSKPDGTFAGASCKDWTSSAATDKAMVGHADARDPMNKWDHWSSTHETHGCDAASLQGTAGRAHLYCFARD